MNFKKATHLIILVLILTIPAQLYSDSISELPTGVGVILGLIAFFLSIRYDKKHPGLIDSSTYLEMPNHSFKALFLI